MRAEAAATMPERQRELHFLFVVNVLNVCNLYIRFTHDVIKLWWHIPRMKTSDCLKSACGTVGTSSLFLFYFFVRKSKA